MMRSLALALAVVGLLLGPASAENLTVSPAGASGGTPGSGTVTSIATGCQATGGTITNTGTISTQLILTSTSPVTSTPYAILTADSCNLLLLNSGASILTLPVATTSGYGNGVYWAIDNQSGGAVTLNVTTSTLDGSSSVSIPSGGTISFQSDGTNYHYVQSPASGGGASGANPTATAGPAAVNGSASTFMRSDGAPLVQKGTNAQFGIVEGDGSTITCVAGVCTAIGGSATSVTQGVTTVGGTCPSGQNLYNNGGILGCQANGGGSALSIPQGRLTLTSGKPVMIADATAQSTIYYDCYNGKQMPVNGTMLTIGSCEISLILDATNHVATNLYDVFAYSASGTLTLCAGPAWTNPTAGTRSVAIDDTTSGFWQNSATLTTCVNNSVNAGPLTAGQATYLGTTYATANGQTGMQFRPTAAAGGTNNILGLYNAYNRVRVSSREVDATATWQYGTNTWRPFDGATANVNNRIRFVDGLQQSFINASFTASVFPVSANAISMTGVNLDSTSATPGEGSEAFFVTASSVVLVQTTNTTFPPQSGLHFIQAMEIGTSGTNTQYSGSTSGVALSQLVAQLEM